MSLSINMFNYLSMHISMNIQYSDYTDYFENVYKRSNFTT